MAVVSILNQSRTMPTDTLTNGWTEHYKQDHTRRFEPLIDVGAMYSIIIGVETSDWKQQMEPTFTERLNLKTLGPVRVHIDSYQYLTDHLHCI